MGDFLSEELKTKQFVSQINTDFSGNADFSENGDQIIDLDKLGANLVLNARTISNLFAGQREIIIVGSDSYNVEWGAEFAADVALISGVTLPTLENGADKVNWLFFGWRRAISPQEILVKNRLVSLIKAVNPAFVAPVAPTIVSFTIENTDPDSLVMVLSEACSGDLTGFGIASDGDPISITGLTSGSGSGTWNIALSRDVVAGELLTVLIDGTNTIISVATSLALDFSGSPYSVTNNTVDYIIWEQLIDAVQTGDQLDSVDSPGAAIVSTPITKEAGRGVVMTIDDYTVNNNATIAITSVDTSELFLSTTVMEHGAYTNNTNLATILNNSIDQFYNGTVANGDTISLELADDGGGGFNVLYKVNSTVHRTVALGIVGNIYVHAKIQGAGKIISNARLL